jgi:NAD(P)H-hydrate epimerase
MQLPPLSRQQVRQVDRVAIETYGMSGLVLMENAGRGAASVIDSVAGPGKIVILCGGGNNGGDGYVAARHLQLSGREVTIVSIVELASLQGDARVNASIASKAEIDVFCAAEPDWTSGLLTGASTIVDGLLGTGARGPLRGRYAAAVNTANECDALRVALDIPSGLDCDSGQAGDPTFRADHTITFVAPKLGFSNRQAAAYVGVVHVVDIGVPLKLLDELLPRQA